MPCKLVDVFHQQRLVLCHQFAGHIACDSASRSEIVLPFYKNGAIAGVLDIDSPLPARFDEEDLAGLEQFVRVLERAL